MRKSLEVLLDRRTEKLNNERNNNWVGGKSDVILFLINHDKNQDYDNDRNVNESIQRLNMEVPGRFSHPFILIKLLFPKITNFYIAYPTIRCSTYICNC